MCVLGYIVCVCVCVGGGGEDSVCELESLKCC